MASTAPPSHPGLPRALETKPDLPQALETDLSQPRALQTDPSQPRALETNPSQRRALAEAALHLLEHGLARPVGASTQQQGGQHLTQGLGVARARALQDVGLRAGTRVDEGFGNNRIELRQHIGKILLQAAERHAAVAEEVDLAAEPTVQAE